MSKRVSKADVMAAQQAAEAAQLAAVKALTIRFYQALIEEGPDVLERVLDGCGRLVTGDPNHLSYAPFKGWKRLLVPLDQLRDECRDHHKQFHAIHGHRRDKR